jgi:hypothetical protein
LGIEPDSEKRDGNTLRKIVSENAAFSRVDMYIHFHIP